MCLPRLNSFTKSTSLVVSTIGFMGITGSIFVPSTISKSCKTTPGYEKLSPTLIPSSIIDDKFTSHSCRWFSTPWKMSNSSWHWGPPFGYWCLWASCLWGLNSIFFRPITLWNFNSTCFAFILTWPFTLYLIGFHLWIMAHNMLYEHGSMLILCARLGHSAILCFLLFKWPSFPKNSTISSSRSFVWWWSYLIWIFKCLFL